MRPVNDRPSLPRLAQASIQGIAAGVGDLIVALTNTFAEYGFRLNHALPKDGSEALTGPLQLASFPASNLPPADAFEGAVIYVPDGSSGQKFRGSDGTNWVNLG